MLLHILLFDKSYNLTYWLNYSELKAQLRRRALMSQPQLVRYHQSPESSTLALRLANTSAEVAATRN